MIGYYTDNSISKSVMEAVAKAGFHTEHINRYNPEENSIFYGILRGTGAAMKISQLLHTNYWYIDNGYFGAEYIDRNGFKEMSGKHRICKNDMSDMFIGEHYPCDRKPKKILVTPPSPYTANFYDTTPEDWMHKWSERLSDYEVIIQNKGTTGTLGNAMANVDTVLAFNSMAVLGALEQGLLVYDTHGCFRNSDWLTNDNNYQPAFNEVKLFYDMRNFTLDEIATGKSILGVCNDGKRKQLFSY